MAALLCPPVVIAPSLCSLSLFFHAKQWQRRLPLLVVGHVTILASFLKAAYTSWNQTFVKLPLIPLFERAVPFPDSHWSTDSYAGLVSYHPARRSQALATLCFLPSFECITSSITLYSRVLFSHPALLFILVPASQTPIHPTRIIKISLSLLNLSESAKLEQ